MLKWRRSVSSPGASALSFLEARQNSVVLTKGRLGIGASDPGTVAIFFLDRKFLDSRLVLGLCEIWGEIIFAHRVFLDGLFGVRLGTYRVLKPH